jgi:hypothetical protein
VEAQLWNQLVARQVAYIPVALSVHMVSHSFQVEVTSVRFNYFLLPFSTEVGFDRAARTLLYAKRGAAPPPPHFSFIQLL